MEILRSSAKGNFGAGYLASFLLHLIAKYFYDWLTDWDVDSNACLW